MTAVSTATSSRSPVRTVSGSCWVGRPSTFLAHLLVATSSGIFTGCRRRVRRSELRRWSRGGVQCRSRRRARASAAQPEPPSGHDVYGEVQLSAPPEARSFFVLINDPDQPFLAPWRAARVLPGSARSVEFTGMNLAPGGNYMAVIEGFSSDIASSAPIGQPFNMAGSQVTFVATKPGVVLGDSVDCGGYPHCKVPCSHAPYLIEGKCENSDWGPVKNGSPPTTWSPEWRYGYRNCTDYVAWRLEKDGVPRAKVRDLGNGGDWGKSAAAPSRLYPVDHIPIRGAAASKPGSKRGPRATSHT